VVQIETVTPGGCDESFSQYHHWIAMSFTNINVTCASFEIRCAH
jgi:hypothetical protein